MARGSARKNILLNPNAEKALYNMKYEIAGQLGLPVQAGSEDYWGNLTSRECGAVGGEMVRRLVQQAQDQLSSGTQAQQTQQTQQAQQAQQTQRQ